MSYSKESEHLAEAVKYARDGNFKYCSYELNCIFDNGTYECYLREGRPIKEYGINYYKCAVYAMMYHCIIVERDYRKHNEQNPDKIWSTDEIWSIITLRNCYEFYKFLMFETFDNSDCYNPDYLTYSLKAGLTLLDTSDFEKADILSGLQSAIWRGCNNIPAIIAYRNIIKSCSGHILPELIFNSITGNCHNFYPLPESFICAIDFKEPVSYYKLQDMFYAIFTRTVWEMNEYKELTENIKYIGS